MCRLYLLLQQAKITSQVPGYIQVIYSSERVSCASHIVGFIHPRLLHKFYSSVQILTEVLTEKGFAFNPKLSHDVKQLLPSSQKLLY